MDKVQIYGCVLGALAVVGCLWNIARGDSNKLAEQIGMWLVMLPFVGRVFGWW